MNEQDSFHQHHSQELLLKRVRKWVWTTKLKTRLWVSVYGLTSHSTHNRSFQRRVFPGNQLHWYWQPKTIIHNTTYTRNTKEKQKKTALANKTICILTWYPFYDLRSENAAGPILTAPEPTQGTQGRVQLLLLTVPDLKGYNTGRGQICIQWLSAVWLITQGLTSHLTHHDPYHRQY